MYSPAVGLPHPADNRRSPPIILRDKKEVFFMSKNNTSEKVRLMCLSGIMAALYLALDVIAVTASAPLGGNMKISLSGLPVIIVSIYGGPIWGAATGFIGAFLGQLFTYGLTVTTLLWVLPAVVRGLVVGYLFRLFKKSMNLKVLILETAISSIIVTALNTVVMFIDGKVYHYPQPALVAEIPSRVVAGVLTAIVFSLMLPTIVDGLNNFIGKTRKTPPTLE